MTIDELDLGFEDPDRGRHRHRRAAPPTKARKKRRRRGRTTLALLLVLLLLGGLAGAVWWGYDKLEGFLTTPDYNSGGTSEVTVEVREGETLTDMAKTLFSAGVVKSEKAFVEATDANPRSRNIEPGLYKVRKEMRASEALAMLLDTKNKLVNKVTIPEGRTSFDIYKILAQKTGLKLEDFVAAAKDPIALGVGAHWFVRTDGKPVTKSIEGFLFPATYEIQPGLTAAAILKLMVGQFNEVATSIDFNKIVERDRGGISPYEALIVASLAQAEAGVAVDIGKIARVAYNRAYVKDMPLQFDVTINYFWALTGKPTKASKDMTNADLNDAKNPYSTHAHKGLPPTPINNPGKLALEGAMAPPPGGWIFFVAVDKAGNSRFANTDSEHEANKRIACQNGILTC